MDNPSQSKFTCKVSLNLTVFYYCLISEETVAQMD